MACNRIKDMIKRQGVYISTVLFFDTKMSIFYNMFYLFWNISFFKQSIWFVQFNLWDYYIVFLVQFYSQIWKWFNAHVSALLEEKRIFVNSELLSHENFLMNVFKHLFWNEKKKRRKEKWSHIDFSGSKMTPSEIVTFLTTNKSWWNWV